MRQPTLANEPTYIAFCEAQEAAATVRRRRCARRLRRYLRQCWRDRWCFVALAAVVLLAAFVEGLA